MDLTITLSTAFVLTAGFTDNVGPGLQLGASARYDWDTWGLSLGLEFRGVFPAGVVARMPVDVDPGETAPGPVPFDASQLGAQLVPCVHFAKYLAGCGVVQGFVVLTQDHFNFQSFPGLAIGPRLAVEVPFAERFAAFAFGEALVRSAGGAAEEYSTPPIKGVPGVRWEQPIVSGFLGVGVSVKFK